MISRRELNKKITNEIEREKTIKFSKKLSLIFLIIVIIIVLIFLYMRFLGTSFIKTTEKYLYDNIPHSFNGLKVLQISDLMYGSTISDSDLEKISNEVKMSKNAIKGELDNEDYEILLDKCGFEVLINNTKEIFNKTVDKIIIKGLDSNNVENVDNTESYTICLIHNFDYFDKFNTNCDVTFAGHNLGGEIRLPFTKGILGDSKYKGNYYVFGNNEVFISSGLGSKHKLRLFNHPEINVYRIYEKGI